MAEHQALASFTSIYSPTQGKWETDTVCLDRLDVNKCV